MRATILSLACVAGLTLGASHASAGSISISFNRPAPVVVVRPLPTYYPPAYQPYYPPVYVQPAPIFVAPRPAYNPGWNVPRYPHHTPYRGHNHGHPHGHNHGRR